MLPKSTLWSRALGLFLLFCLSIACGDKEVSSYKAMVAEQRAYKNQEMVISLNSPILSSEKSIFLGLHYFPIDYAWKKKAKLKINSQPSKVSLRTSDSKERDYVIYATASFEHDNVEFQLNIYKEVVDGDSTNLQELLIIPFKDLSSGKTTYGAGRFLNPEIVDDQTVILDFNQAYNPYCAYNDAYSCPLPPESNLLAIEINAGEKQYH